MKFSKGLLILLVLATVALLSQGSQEAQDSKRDKKVKGKKRQQAEIIDTVVTEHPESPVINQEVTSPDDVDIVADVVPSEAHNGKLGKKHNKERKAAKKAAKRAGAKAMKKAEKKRLRKEERKMHKHGDKAAKKAAKKAERKAAKNIQRQEDVSTELVSFDDIVEERHGDPIPNPLPPVEGASTEDQDAGGAVNEQAIEKNDERRQQKKQRKQAKKEARQAHRHHKDHITCENNSDCGHGSCCVEKKGSKFCTKSRKDEGQKCTDDCMCRAGLACISESAGTGRERGFCRVQGTPELDTGNKIGTVEDAVEDAIGANQ